MNEDKGFFSRKSLIRTALLIGAAVIILLIVPKADRQAYTYELGQPWKYPVPTADFDMPVMRDSASSRAMRDSIENNFAPFVKRNSTVAAANVQRFRNAIAETSSPQEVALLTNLLAQAYGKGIVPVELYNNIHRGNNRKVRHFNKEHSDDGHGAPTVSVLDGGDFLAPRMAYSLVDSGYSAATGAQRGQMPPRVAKALTICIVPDVTLDTVNDERIRAQEYVDVNGALGVIKSGQRIVDRGEIVTPQVFTNLNTYLEMLSTRESDRRNQARFIIGQALYILICLSILYFFLALYRSRFFADLQKMTFIVTFITLFVVVATLMFEYVALGIYLVPFAAVPVIVLIFFDSRTAIFSLLTTVLLSSLVATYQFQFVFLELLAGLCAIFSIHQLSRRSQLLRTAGVTFVAYVIGFATLCLLTDGNLQQFTLRMLLLFLFNSVILSFAYILILIVEKIFGFTSTVTLVELSDINNPLLRRLAEEAPGTFQHSMQVSTLASEAARAIGANTQLVRTGALYHDIGKMESPAFFTENQHGVNPHDGLDPETSAHKIIRHVTDGLTLAKEAKLPAVIRDFISEHHGRGVTKYFYNTAVNNAEGKPVDPEKFRYPGPDPRSKETAILMVADSVEAASRSLKDYSDKDIDALVDRIIDSQIAEGRLKDAPISFRDVETIKRTFKKRLATIYHSRVAYPEIKKAAAETEIKKETQAL